MNMNPSPDPSAPERGQPWQRTLYIMFAAQLLSMIGFAFVLPFLPFYIRELGVTDERLVPVWAGVMTAAVAGIPRAPGFRGLVWSAVQAGAGVLTNFVNPWGRRRAPFHTPPCK